MKKLVLLSMMIMVSVAVLAVNFSAYGSARMGFWYDMEDEDYSMTGEDRLNLDYYMQGNSRFGVNFNHEDITAMVEFSGAGAIRHLWARYNFGNWSMLVGQTETGFNELSGQVYASDNGFIGYGSAWDGRRPMVRLEWVNGFYTAFIQPNQLGAEGDGNQLKDIMIPKINLGYKTTMDQLYLHFSAGLNMVNYNEDAGNLDDGLMSFVAAGTGAYHMDDVTLKAQAFFGMNAENYGITSVVPARAWVHAGEIEDVTTIGFFADVAYKASDTMRFGGGFGMAMADSDEWEDSYDVMSFFLQMQYYLHKNLRIVPELGMFDYNGDASKMYFGCQLRADF